MSTHSRIYYETNEEGLGLLGAKGVYCHYDGYTDHMLPILEGMSWDEVKEMVDAGIVEGGLRCVDSPGRYETFQEITEVWTEWGVKGWPPRRGDACEYNYLKRLDGTVERTTR